MIIYVICMCPPPAAFLLLLPFSPWLLAVGWDLSIHSGTWQRMDPVKNDGTVDDSEIPFTTTWGV